MRYLLVVAALCIVGCGGGGSGDSGVVTNSVTPTTSTPTTPVAPSAPTLTFNVSAPSTVTDYAPFVIEVSDVTAVDESAVLMQVTQTEGKSVYFSSVDDMVYSAHSPNIFEQGHNVSFDVTVTHAGQTVTQAVSFPVNYTNRALDYDDGLAFTPSTAIVNKLESDNYFTWDMFSSVRTETTKFSSNNYCYPTPDPANCNSEDNVLPGFIPASMGQGDFNGDGHQDMVFIADIGSRVYKFRNRNDLSKLSSIHILLNDGKGRLYEDKSIYATGEAPRLPAPYRLEVADVNADGIDDIWLASFGTPILIDDGTNTWDPYPHLLMLSQDSKFIRIDVPQNEAQYQLIPDTEIAFAHDNAQGDVDGDGDIDFFANAVVYFNDGAGGFTPKNLNINEAGTDKVAKTHAHASAMGDFNADGIADLAIFWTQIATPDNEWGSASWTNVLLGPVTLDAPVMLYDERWQTLPEPPSEEFINYNDAYSDDINGDGLDDIVVGITKKDPYYESRYIQILVSQGDGSFVDETASRYPNQSRAQKESTALRVGNGEGEIELIDVNNDGFLDIIDFLPPSTMVDGIEYAGLNLLFNDGQGNFTEVPTDYLPERMKFSYFDNYGFDYLDPEGTKFEARGVINLDNNGHLDFVSMIQMSYNPEGDNLDQVEAFVATLSIISKQ